jgi:hypothetical protein
MAFSRFAGFPQEDVGPRLTRVVVDLAATAGS